MLSNKTDPGFLPSEHMYPLTMMGVALDRYLPGRYSMLVNETILHQPSLKSC